MNFKSNRKSRLNHRTAAGLSFASIMLMGAVSALHVNAQSAYSNAVMSLNPVAYWPLQETVQPPEYDVETNLGSLGPIANAYYASTNATHSQPGGIHGDSDTCVKFTGATGSFMLVPTTDQRVSLAAGQPFSVECWVEPTGTQGFRGIITQTGPNNAGGLNGSPNSSGWSLNLGFTPYRGTGSGNGPVVWDFHVFNGAGFTGGAEADVPATNWLAGGTNGYTNVWTYLCGVFDGTNCWMYAYSTNMNNALYGGTNATSLQIPITTAPNAPLGGPFTNLPGAAFSPDTWDPIQLGATRGLGGNELLGYLDEVAIYNYALTSIQISNHFAAGTNGLGTYKATISNDSPYMYWRMDAPRWTPPPTSNYPVAANYGSAASGMTNVSTGGSGANCGVYQPGTVPGLAGPSFAGFGPFTNACAFNGLVGAVDVGYHNLLNPTGATNNFTLVAWFKGNPMDENRWGVIASHTDRSWKAQINTGTIYGYRAAGGQASISPATYNVNDGTWHMYALASAYTNGVSTNLTLYLDNGSVSATIANTNSTVGTNVDAWIGGASDYMQPTNETNYNTSQQYFAGEICHVAYFTNALTLTQIQMLYSNAVSSVNTNPTNITFAFAGGTLTLSWPADHIGWQLQSNSVGLTATNAWFSVPGSAITNQVIISPIPADANVFYRLFY